MHQALLTETSLVVNAYGPTTPLNTLDFEFETPSGPGQSIYSFCFPYPVSFSSDATYRLRTQDYVHYVRGCLLLPTLKKTDASEDATFRTQLPTTVIPWTSAGSSLAPPTWCQANCSYNLPCYPREIGRLVSPFEAIQFIRIHSATSVCPCSRAILRHSILSQGHHFCLAHFRTSSLPPMAATQQVSSFHRHPLSRAHRRTSKCPYKAAALQVSASQGHPSALAHCSMASCPFFAAPEHVSSFQRHPSFLAHFSIARFPFLAASRHKSSSGTLRYLSDSLTFWGDKERNAKRHSVEAMERASDNTRMIRSARLIAFGWCSYRREDATCNQSSLHLRVGYLGVCCYRRARVQIILSTVPPV